MKILNAGTADFIVRDKRGNSVVLEPKNTVEVTESTGNKIARVYPFIKIVEEPKKVEPKEEVSRETKKPKRKKNVLNNY